MSTLAQLLFDLGNQVAGYDDVRDYKFTQPGLDERGIPIYYDGNHELDKDTIVTYSRAFREDHPELVRMKELGMTIKKYNEIIGELTAQFKTISVSGTHGKTTTSTLISHLLNSTKGCNYFIGDGTGYANQQNSLFVIESDEFNKHFLAYHPTYSVVTNIELEHTECYDGLEDIIQTFSRFANENTKDFVVVCGDNENIRQISFEKPVIYYGFDEQNNTVARNVELTSEGSSFDVYRQGEFYGHFDLPLYGKHMILNALAAIEIAIKEGLDQKTIHDLLKTFKNAKRRFAEESFGKIVTIDDYAHHPTEIKVTLEAVRQKYPDRPLVAVFKPNTYSRTKEFTQEFIDALDLADAAYVTEIDCNRERQEEYPGITSHSIIDQLKNGALISEETVDQLLQYQNPVVVFMSCASIAHLKEAYQNLIDAQ